MFFQFLPLSSIPISFPGSRVYRIYTPIQYTKLTNLGPETNCFSPKVNLKQSFHIELKILDTVPLTLFGVRLGENAIFFEKCLHKEMYAELCFKLLMPGGNKKVTHT